MRGKAKLGSPADEHNHHTPNGDSAVEAPSAGTFLFNPFGPVHTKRIHTGCKENLGLSMPLFRREYNMLRNVQVFLAESMEIIQHKSHQIADSLRNSLRCELWPFHTKACCLPTCLCARKFQCRWKTPFAFLCWPIAPIQKISFIDQCSKHTATNQRSKPWCEKASGSGVGSFSSR